MTRRASIRGKGADIFFSPVALPPPNGEEVQTSTTRPSPRFSAKATFYFTPQQLLAMEQLRLILVTHYGLKVDKSEIMRLALEFLIGDLEKNQNNSVLVQQLR